MKNYSEFSELLERNCSLGWRSVVFSHENELIDLVEATAFTMSQDNDLWTYSFAIKYQGRWRQAKKEVEPITTDFFDLGPSMENQASTVSLEILMDIAEQV